MIGNALEVIEVVEVLRGDGPEDLSELCLHLAGWMLHLGGVSKTVAEGTQLSSQLISSGKALDKFRHMIELQGGDARVVDDTTRLLQARQTCQIVSPKTGVISSMQCEHIGTACVILGGGRERKEDSVDPAVGIVLHKKVGDQVAGQEPLATVYYNSDARAQRACRLIADSIQIADVVPAKRPLIHRVIQRSGETR
jgi:pyrimidine-nucleoside phosphorylase/thymidine phosphorylase